MDVFQQFGFDKENIMHGVKDKDGNILSYHTKEVDADRQKQRFEDAGHSNLSKVEDKEDKLKEKIKKEK